MACAWGSGTCECGRGGWLEEEEREEEARHNQNQNEGGVPNTYHCAWWMQMQQLTSSPKESVVFLGYRFTGK